MLRSRLARTILVAGILPFAALGVRETGALSRIVTRKLVLTVRRVGVWETARLVARHPGHLRAYTPAGRRARLLPDEFDRRHGVRTSLVLDPAEVGVTGPAAVHARRHQASPPERFRAILGGLPIAFEDYLFLDLGSGLGRALLLAADFPFRRIVGVELAPALHAGAVENIRAYRAAGRRCASIQSVCADAATFPLPPDPLVIYLFNPFRPGTLARVLARLERSLARHPRDVWVIYYWPEHRALVDASPALGVVAADADSVVYRSRGVRATAARPDAGAAVPTGA